MGFGKSKNVVKNQDRNYVIVWFKKPTIINGSLDFTKQPSRKYYFEPLLLSSLPLVIENIILDYQFELELEDRNYNHKKTFNKTLFYIENYNQYIIDDLKNNIFVETDDDTIEVNYDEHQISIQNINNWYPTEDEIVTDILINCLNYFQYQEREEYINDKMELFDLEFDIITQELFLNNHNITIKIIGQWYETMRIMSEFFNTLVELKYKFIKMDDFEIYCENL